MNRKTQKEKTWESLTEALANYLQIRGWKACVIGDPRIRGRLEDPTNYEFCVRFTGAQIERPEFSRSNPASPQGRKSKSSSKKGKD